LSNLAISPEMNAANPPRGGGVLGQLANDMKTVRNLLLQPMIPLKGLSVEEQREKAIAKLVKAIEVTEQLASRAKTTSERGMADTTKARYYHLLGYLVQVLDGVLRSVSLDEIKRHVEETDKELAELKRAIAEAKARAGAAKTGSGRASE